MVGIEWESYLVLGLSVRPSEGSLDHRIYSFYLGTVYSGKDIKKGRDVAVKLEVALERGSRLDREYNVYQAISGIRGIPKMIWYGMEGRYNVLVLSRLGRTLEEMRQLNMLDANTVFAYSKQMVFVPLLKVRFYSHFILSLRFSSHCMITITFISMLNQTIS